jgi:hypothetical protein
MGKNSLITMALKCSNLLKNGKLGSNRLTETNTLAYYTGVLITGSNCFIVQADDILLKKKN